MHEKMGRTERLVVTVTPGQKAAIRAAAKSHRMTMSKFLRTAILFAVHDDNKEKGEKR